MPELPNPFRNLTLDDVESWVKGSTAEKGRKLHDQGAVSDLSLTEDGDLLAWVKGSERHAVMVFFEDSNLTSVCTCPAGNACEHAVAVTYEYLLLDSEGEDLPLATEEDERLALLTELNDEPSEIDAYLDSLTRDELLDLILDLADAFTDVDEEISCRAEEAFSNAGI